VVEDNQDKTGRNNMGIFKKLSKQIKAKNPSAKGEETKNRKGLIGKILGRMKPPGQPIPRREPKPRTQLIDPRLPRGKVGKGPLEPRDSTTRVPAERSGLAGILKKRMAAQAMNPPKLKKGPNDGRGGGGQPPFTPKLPGAKDGGMMKTKGYKAGGLAIKGLGKAFKNSKR
jgi:hypothetical protein